MRQCNICMELKVRLLLSELMNTGEARDTRVALERHLLEDHLHVDPSTDEHHNKIDKYLSGEGEYRLTFNDSEFAVVSEYEDSKMPSSYRVAILEAALKAAQCPQCGSLLLLKFGMTSCHCGATICMSWQTKDAV